MPIELTSDPETFFDLLQPSANGQLTVLLTGQPGSLAGQIDRFPGAADRDGWLIVIDVADGRLSRLNFDIVERVIFDLPPGFLLSSPGRRLTDALGRLAEEELILSFVGDATSTAGAFLTDGSTAALTLVPRTVVVPAIQAVPDLRGLLATISSRGVRLLALDERVAVRYTYQTDQVEVSGQGDVLLAAFQQPAHDAPPVARVQMLKPGACQGWPA